MKDLKSKIVEELDMIQHIANDIGNRKDRESLKRSVKKIRKELKQVKNNDLLHSVSQRYTIEDIERCVENWGICKVEKEYIERFLNCA